MNKDELVQQLTAWTMYVLFLLVALPTVALVAGLAWRLFCFISGIH